MGRAETGQRGEAAAARFYQKQGAELLGHNYHTRMGEIDKNFHGKRINIKFTQKSQYTREVRTHQHELMLS